MLRVRLYDVIDAVAGSSYDTPAIKFNPFERSIASKTGIFDDVIPLSKGVRKAAAQAIQSLKLRQLSQNRDLMFDFSLESLSREFKEAARIAGLGPRTLYDLRHGGASHDALNGVDLSEIQKRGRWLAASSVRRYSKRGRMHEAWSQLGALARAFAITCAAATLHLMSHPHELPAFPAL